MIEIVIPLSQIPIDIQKGLVFGILGIVCILISWKVFDFCDIIFSVVGLSFILISLWGLTTYMIDNILLAMPPIAIPNITFPISFRVT